MKFNIQLLAYFILSINLISSGLKVFIYKKPTIQDNRLMPIFLWFIIFLIFVQSKNLIIISAATLLLPIFYFLVSKFNYGILLPYVDKVDFEKKFLEVLDSMGLNYELKNSSVEIQELKLIMELSQYRPRYGVNLKLKKGSDKILFKEIVSKLRTIEIKSDKTIPIIICLIAGWLLLIFSCILIFKKF
jgi:hypothetical protein